MDRGLGFLDDERQGGTLHLLLAHHRAEGHPDRPQILQHLSYFPPAQPVPSTQQRDHGCEARSELPPRHSDRQVRAGSLPTCQAAARRHLVFGHPHGQRE
jgi:hypothetical protein